MIYSQISRDNKFTFLEDTIIEATLKTFENLYNQKQYSQALDYLNSHQVKFSALEYHQYLSAVFFKLNNYPKARYHFLQAEYYGASHELLIKNESILNKELDLERYESPLNFNDYFYKYSMSFGLDGFSTLSVVIILIGGIILHKSKNIKSWLLLSVISCLPVIFHFWVINWEKYIVENEISLSDGPSEIFLTERKLPPGILIVANEKEGWVEIKYPYRFKGWIKNSNLLRVSLK